MVEDSKACAGPTSEPIRMKFIEELIFSPETSEALFAADDVSFFLAPFLTISSGHSTSSKTAIRLSQLQ